MPGGAAEKGESYRKAAKRELFEESGYKIKGLGHLETSVYRLEDGTKITRHAYWAVYDQKQVIKCLEGEKMKFVDPKEFSKLKIYPGHKDLFELAIRKAQENRLLKK